MKIIKVVFKIFFRAFLSNIRSIPIMNHYRGSWYTVTDGTFIFYTNIISINIILFSSINQFISLANLDLDIQACFYNGMDDIAKIWLQLVFPLYLIVIAICIVLIITSRYSTAIQILTAHRALQVLATLLHYLILRY